MPQVLAESYDFKELVANLITEDDEPVDNLFSERQQRFSVESLYASWRPIDSATNELRKFIAASNVGVFSSVYQPPIVPDVFLSMDVEFQKDWLMKEHRAYFIWEFDKPPDVAIEIVSNTKGGEISKKKNRYAQLDITYYVVFDPFRALSNEKLRVFERGFGKRYVERKDFDLPGIGLSLTLWQGEFEGWTDEWLRWVDADGNLILTGSEQARKEANRAERLADKLRELGVNPQQI